MSIIGEQTKKNLHKFVHCTAFLASLHSSHKLRLVYSIATSYTIQLESIHSTMRGLGESITIIVPYSTYYKPMGDLPYISSEQGVGL